MQFHEGQGEGEMGSDYLMDMESQFQKIKNVLEVNGGGCCTHTNVNVSVL